jgi:hypothetical protein
MPVTLNNTAHTSSSLSFDGAAEAGMTGTVTYTYYLHAGSADFTPAPVVVTLHDGSDGAFSAGTLTFGAGTPPAAQTPTYTPGSAGAKSISVTNNAGLTNPAPFTYTSIDPDAPQLCTVSVRVRNGSGDLVQGCQVRATLVSEPDTVADALLTQQVVTGTTASDGTMTLVLLQGHTYIVRGVDPALKPFLWRSVTVPASGSADLWELI